MPFLPSGYVLPPNSTAINGTTILAETHNIPIEDIGQALNNVVRRDGIAPMLAAADFGGFRARNAANGTAPTDLVTLGQMGAAITTATTGISSKLDMDFGNATVGFLRDIKWLSKAIGEYYWADDNVNGVDIPPRNSTLYRFVELTAGLTGSGQYNNGVLTNEVVSGSVPLVSATARVSLEGSPMNGQTIRLINTERRMLRAGIPGSIENDQMQVITGSISGPNRWGQGSSSSSGALGHSQSSGQSAGSESSTTRLTGISFNSANSPGARVGNETRPKNIGVRVFRRVK